VIIAGQGKEAAQKAVRRVLTPYFKIGREIFIYPADLENPAELKFLIKKSSLPILIVIRSDNNSEKIRQLIKMMPSFGHLILNSDDSKIEEINGANLKALSFGFSVGADFQAGDINANGGTNFKVSYKGNVVPFWLDGVFQKEQIYQVLSAIAVATLFDLNLVEISQSLKNYRPELLTE